MTLQAPSKKNLGIFPDTSASLSKRVMQPLKQGWCDLPGIAKGEKRTGKIIARRGEKRIPGNKAVVYNAIKKTAQIAVFWSKAWKGCAAPFRHRTYSTVHFPHVGFNRRRNDRVWAEVGMFLWFTFVSGTDLYESTLPQGPPAEPNLGLAMPVARPRPRLSNQRVFHHLNGAMI